MLSIDEVVRRTGLEESLLRFYESEYPNELPAKILRGDTLFFDAASIPAFNRIHARHHRSAAGTDSATKPYGRVIAVTSGKGGVGKTNLALNLAIEFQRLGRMSVVLDGDMGLANVHLLAGIQPRATLTDLLSRDRAISDIIEEGPEGIGIIAGGSGILRLADSSPEERRTIVGSLKALEEAAEIIIVDTGAGMGRGVRDFLRAADEIIFVITPDLTSLADAYGLLKTLHREDPAARSLYLVVNMVQTLKQAAQVALRFSGCAREFLGREVHNAGYIMRDSVVSAATARRSPYTVFRPQARASKNTRNIAVELANRDCGELRQSSAFARYLNLIRAGEREESALRRRET